MENEAEALWDQLQVGGLAPDEKIECHLSSTFLKGSSSNSEFLTFAVKRDLRTKTRLDTDPPPDPGPDVRNAVREE